MRDCYQCCFCQNMSGVMSSRCRVLVFIIIYFYSGEQVDGWRGPAQLYLAVSNEGWSKILGFVWTAAVLQKTTAELQKSSHSRMAPPSYLGTCCIVSCGCVSFPPHHRCSRGTGGLGQLTKNWEIAEEGEKRHSQPTESCAEGNAMCGGQHGLPSRCIQTALPAASVLGKPAKLSAPVRANWMAVRKNTFCCGCTAMKIA